MEWLGFFEVISSQLHFFPWVLLLWTPRWLRSGVAAPRPRRIRRSECLQRQEAAVEARQRRRRVLRVLEWREWCGWRWSCCCCWDSFFWRYTSRCCGAARCGTEMTLWARSRWRRWVLWRSYIFFLQNQRIWIFTSRKWIVILAIGLFFLIITFICLFVYFYFILFFFLPVKTICVGKFQESHMAKENTKNKCCCHWEYISFDWELTYDFILTF